MIQEIQIINYQKDPLNINMFDPSKTGIYIKSIEGFGPPPASVETTKNVNQDPSKYQNTQINPRNIVLTLGITNDYIVEEVRQRIYRYFIQGIPVKIVIITDVVGSVYITGYVETITPDIFSNMETVQVSIICPDPFFYTGGKMLIESSDKTGNFNFTTWWESNVKNGELDGIEKPISIMNETDESGGIPVLLIYNSNVENPKGFEMEITQKDNMFYKIVLEYEGGKLLINPEDLDGAPSIDKNLFKNASIIIKNNIDEQNVYRKDILSGDMISILDKVIIQGDFPEIKRGSNYFLSKIYGVYKGVANDKIENFYYNEYAESIYRMGSIGIEDLPSLEPKELFFEYNEGLYEFPIGVTIEPIEAAYEYNSESKEYSYKYPRAYRLVYKIYNSNNKYIGSISFRHDACIMDKYIRHSDEYSYDDLTITLSDSYDYDIPTDYKMSSDGERYFIVKDPNTNEIDSINMEYSAQNVYYTLQMGDSYARIVLQSYRLKGNKKYAYSKVNNSVENMDHFFGLNGDEFEIPNTNIFESNGYLYMFNAIFYYRLDEFSDPIDPLPLIFEMSDLRIPIEEFLEILWTTTTDRDKIPNLLGMGKAYVNVRKEDNNYHWDDDLPIYQQTYDGKIILSYDDYYDAI